ncbi:MAG: type II toxin-antitoxin system Phd/YefM family antitoxin [Alphaproteobacteria bacterium]
MRRVTSTEFQKKIGVFQDLALKEPVVVTRNGRDRVVVLAAEEYYRLKRRDREVLRVEDLTQEDLEAIAQARPSAESAKFDHEVE